MPNVSEYKTKSIPATSHSGQDSRTRPPFDFLLRFHRHRSDQGTLTDPGPAAAHQSPRNSTKLVENRSVNHIPTFGGVTYTSGFSITDREKSHEPSRRCSWALAGCRNLNTAAAEAVGRVGSSRSCHGRLASLYLYDSPSEK